jgi:hypothetical protein
MQAVTLLALVALLAASPCIAAEASQLDSSGDPTTVEAQAALFRPRDSALLAASALPNLDIWSRGLSDPKVQPPSDRAVGLNIRPLPVAGFAIGWEVRRASTPDAVSESDMSWKYSWERASQQAGTVSLGFTAGGTVGLLRSAVSQHLTSYMAVSLGKVASLWNSELRLSPELAFDALSRTWTMAATPELKAETLLSEPDARLRSAVNLKLGYRLSPELKPALAVGVEWKVTPVL